jgi:hypothetical protein
VCWFGSRPRNPQPRQVRQQWLPHFLKDKNISIPLRRRFRFWLLCVLSVFTSCRYCFFFLLPWGARKPNCGVPSEEMRTPSFWSEGRLRSGHRAPSTHPRASKMLVNGPSGPDNSAGDCARAFGLIQAPWARASYAQANPQCKRPVSLLGWLRFKKMSRALGRNVTPSLVMYRAV